MSLISNYVGQLNDSIQDKIDTLKDLSCHLSKYNNRDDCSSCFDETVKRSRELYKELEVFIEMVKHYGPIITEIDQLLSGSKSQEISKFLKDVELLWGRKVNILTSTECEI